MTNTSSPRTFSWISTKISRSAKRRTTAFAGAMLRYEQIASASGRLLLPLRIFIREDALASLRAVYINSLADRQCISAAS